jgi:phosphatidylglycerophosphate synthase
VQPTTPADDDPSADTAASPSLLERYRRMFNKQGPDWWTVVFGYPIARMLVLLLPRHRWVTPTALTILGFALKIPAAICLYYPGVESLICAIVALQLSAVLDCMDGTLARARGLGSLVGAFLDKVLDAVGLFTIFAVVGIRAYADTGEPWLLVGACGAAAAHIVLCYMFWVVRATEERPATAATLAAEVEAPSWGQIGRQWLRGWADIVKFNEFDLYVWICVFAAFEQWRYLVYLLAVTQGIMMLKRGVDHVRTLARRQREG